MTTIDQAFRVYASNLEITDRQEACVAERRARTVKALKRSLVLHPEEGKVTGSWDRRTLTRLLREGDVDVFVVLHYGENKGWDNPDGTVGALDRFRAILDAEFPATEKRRDRNCISVRFPEFTLDVVPAFKVDDRYYQIPDSVRRLWVPTNPFAFAELVTAANKRTGGRFVPVIKQVKGWNREVGWPIRSFHLECMLLRHFQTYSALLYDTAFPSLLVGVFAALPGYLGGSWCDPILGDRIDTYLDSAAARTRRQVAIDKARAAAVASERAYAAQSKDPARAIREWKSLLGTFFPTYG